MCCQCGQCDEIQKSTIPTGVHTAKGPNLPQARKKEANPITKVIMEWSLVDIQNKVMKIICTHTANFIPLLQMVLKHSLKLALFNKIKSKGFFVTFERTRVFARLLLYKYSKESSP